MVPDVVGVPGGLSNPPPSEGRPDHPDTPRECPGDDAPTSRLASLRRRYQDKEISQEGTEQSFPVSKNISALCPFVYVVSH